MFAALWAKPAVKLGVVVAVLLAIAGLVFGALRYVDSVRSEAFDAGKNACEVQVQTNTIVIQKEINRAEDRGPRTPADASRILRQHTF